MEVKDLRIGNLFFSGKLLVEIKGIHTQTYGLNHDREVHCYVRFLDNDNRHYEAIDIKDLKPIPLTAEWLLKLGFAQDGDEYSKENFTIRPNRRDLIIEGFEYDYNGIILSTEHFYVHDLQNLYFAIKRQELECN